MIDPTLINGEMVSARRRAQNWQLGLAWGAVTVGGLLFGSLTGLMLVWMVTFDLNPRSLALPWFICFGLAGFIAGIILGIAQMGVTEFLPRLRRISRPGYWILASGLGLGLGAMLVELLSFTPLRRLGGDNLVGAEVEAAYIMLGGLIIGALVGFAQWLVMRREIGRAGWWIVAMAASGGLFMPGLLATLGTIGDLPFAAGVDALLTPIWVIFLIPAALFLPGIITGATYVWLVVLPEHNSG